MNIHDLTNSERNQLKELKKLIQPFADRWNETKEWHSQGGKPSFRRGNIETDTGFLEDCAKILNKRKFK